MNVQHQNLNVVSLIMLGCITAHILLVYFGFDIYLSNSPHRRSFMFKTYALHKCDMAGKPDVVTRRVMAWTV
jgi:hypothetical protein